MTDDILKKLKDLKLEDLKNMSESEVEELATAAKKEKKEIMEFMTRDSMHLESICRELIENKNLSVEESLAHMKTAIILNGFITVSIAGFVLASVDRQEREDLLKTELAEQLSKAIYDNQTKGDKTRH